MKRVAKIGAILGWTGGIFVLGVWAQQARDQPVIRGPVQLRTVERTVPGPKRTVTVKVPVRNARCELAVDQANSTLTSASSNLSLWLNKADQEVGFPPGGGHRGYAAVVDGSGLMAACWCSHSMGGR